MKVNTKIELQKKGGMELSPKFSDKTIMENVLLLAKKKGWNNKKAADEIGITPQYFYRIKSGEKGLGHVTIKRITEAFGVTEEDLLKPMNEDNGGGGTPESEAYMKEEYLEIIKQKDKIIEQLQSVINILTDNRDGNGGSKDKEKKAQGRVAG